MKYVDLELDAYDLAEKIFSENNDFNKNLSFSNIDTKTFFEMLLIITVEGLKKFYGDENKKVNIIELHQKDVDKINKYLEKIGIKLNFKIYDTDSYNVIRNNSLLKNFTEIEINDKTKLNTINYIINKSKFNLVYVINFDFTIMI